MSHDLQLFQKAIVLQIEKIHLWLDSQSGSSVGCNHLKKLIQPHVRVLFPDFSQQP
jgi:hypothetical protein